MTAPAYIKAMSAGVRARLREREHRADKKQLTAEIATTERALQNAVDALVSLGKSSAVLTRIRELEARQATLEQQVRMIDKPPRVVPNVERSVLARIERLENAACDSDRVRAEAQELIGTVRVI